MVSAAAWVVEVLNQAVVSVVTAMHSHLVVSVAVTVAEVLNQPVVPMALSVNALLHSLVVWVAVWVEVWVAVLSKLAVSVDKLPGQLVELVDSEALPKLAVAHNLLEAPSQAAETTSQLPAEDGSRSSKSALKAQEA